MILQYICVASLPSLAWCALIGKNQAQVTIFHGTGVVPRPEAFVEGAWNGDFNQSNFLEASVMSGTGGRAENGSIRFTGSTDRLNPLCSVDTLDTRYVSNSMLLSKRSVRVLFSVTMACNLFPTPCFSFSASVRFRPLEKCSLSASKSIWLRSISEVASVE